MRANFEIAKFLKQNNINDIFYLPGIQTLSLDEAFVSYGINVFMGRYESNIAYIAEGYSRAADKAGVVFITPGPGLGNVVSGCMEAYGDDSPLIVVHIDTNRAEHGRGVLHELAEPENIFRYFTKKTFYVSSLQGLVPALEEAYRTAVTDRKGPVVISIPFIFLDKEVPAGKTSTGKGLPSSAGYEGRSTQQSGAQLKDTMERMISLLRDKERPLLICGKSVMFDHAREILGPLCMRASMPFFTTTGGKGIIDERMPCSFGNVIQKGIVKKILGEADVVIAVGTRLRDVDAKRRGVKIEELVHIDIDDRWLGKNYPTAISASHDLRDLLGAFDELFSKRRFNWDLDRLKKEQERERRTLRKREEGLRIIEAVRDAIPDDTVTIWDLSLISYWAEYYFPVYRQRTFLMPRGISPIFYGLPASIGAKAGAPDRPCLGICGDGGAFPGISELSTMKKYNIPVVILVYNNGCFGTLEDMMRKRYGKKGSMDLVNPDFVKIARAFDIKAKRTGSAEGLKKILQGMRWDEPYLIEFQYPLFSTPWG